MVFFLFLPQELCDGFFQNAAFQGSILELTHSEACLLSHLDKHRQKSINSQKTAEPRDELTARLMVLRA